MNSKKNVDNRYRNWACVVYPDDANLPSNWLEIVADLKTPVFVSPLHDKDLNPTGEQKKSHYHVMIMFDGKKSKDQVEDIFSLFSGVGCEIVNTKRGYARYLCHLDNPEKHQYCIDDVMSFGGADYNDVIGLPCNKYNAIREMKNWCNENGVLMYCDLFDYAADERPDWFRLLCDSCTLVMKEYLKSKEYSIRCSNSKK